MKKKLLVFQPIIAPYRIDFFNRLSREFETKVCLMWRNLHDQTFKYSEIEKQFDFKPVYLERKTLHVPRGVISTVRQYGPDVVVVSECGITSILVLLYKMVCRKKYRVISMIDDSYDTLANDRHFTKRHKYATKLLVPRFDNIICVEPRVVDYYRDKYGKGVLFPIIADDRKARERYERILPISETYVHNFGLDGKKVVLFVGRMVECKNLDGLVEAFKRIADPNAVLVMVGSGDIQEELQRLAESDSRIRMVGRFEGDELYAWYNIADVFCLPSFVEMFGAVTNEALLGGCWSIVSQRAGSNCLIEEGINGNLIDPENITDLYQKLDMALSKANGITLPLRIRDNYMNCDFESMIRPVIDVI